MADLRNADLVFYVGTNADVFDTGTYTLALENQQYWTYKNGEIRYLGTITSVDSSTGLVTFSTNATADANGVYNIPDQ